ncbi:MG2 domain-containing protein [Mucilaginibacter jinjuensis]|uniref:MG2 domain-containing protein n=1 Tax=Mucilaginibacter jinjuensis TaxID=1176721 RepID=A0ABY7T3S5_9SPHI|nr:MG2 domain-containing protein [Mucilaginibacter jinjuensis]WCT11042.1 MG2 domain-containing protein [Mucilaginibacter jinjuensis]
MKPLPLNFLKYILLTILVFKLTDGTCQTASDSSNTKSIESLETAIVENKTLVQTRQELEVIKKQAQKANNDVLLARSLYDLMQIRDRRTEDTLYFRNSAFIDTLLQNKPRPALRAILLVMRAQRISNFDSRSLRFNGATYRTKDLKTDYAALTRSQRDSLVENDLNAAVQYRNTKIDGKQLFWLSSNPDVFLFDPKFEDIVLAERVNLLASRRFYSNEARPSLTNWLSLNSTDFRSKLDSLAAYAKNSNIMAAYQHWLSFHKTDAGVSAFIESLARKNIYLNGNADSLTRNIYIKYLQAGITSPYAELKAHSVYQLCLTWNEEGNKYASFGNQYTYDFYRNFAPQYQFYPAKALELYEQNKNLILKYPVFNTVLNSMALQIKASTIRIEMDNQHLPGNEIPIRAMYRNVDKLYYRVIRIGSTELPGAAMVKATAQLLNHEPVAQGDFALPLPADHNKHGVYLKLKQLPAGHYRLLFSKTPIKTDSYDINNLPFEVTGITAINSDERIYILDRKTGFPLVGAQVKAFKKKERVAIEGVINANGYINIEEDTADSLNITYKGDTTGYNFYVRTNNLRNDVYNKHDYDNLADFYNEKVRTEIFTDRSIYRPGQTVHYKIIFLTNDPNTGDPILFNSANIGEDNLKKWLQNANDKIMLQDPFNKKIDSALLKINDYGSFAGSFTIPKTAATGNWRIDSEPRSSYQNNGSFRVEEYKRPTIELNMEKQKKMLLPGEPFVIKFKLRSFNGADLGNLPVNYTISRNGRILVGKSNHNDYIDVKLINKTGYTDEKGELSIPVTDTVVAKANLSDSVIWNFNYHIEATATDATGESTELSERFNISSRPVSISFPLDKTYDRQALPALNVNTSAEFEGVVSRNVNIKLYKVSNPGFSLNSIKPVDQWYYDKADWYTWFPNNANARPVKQEKTLILDTVINTATHGKFILPKNKIAVGFYQLFAEVKENGKITGQYNNNFNVFDSQTGNTPVDDIDYMPVNAAKTGDVLTWYSSGKTENYTLYQVLYVGINKKKVIRNIYETRTEKAGVRVWKYKIPMDATGKLQINRITVQDNKINTHLKRVDIMIDNGAQPEIIVEKYRKVMVPGAQETFTISVKTKSVNVAAEIMSTLYDASLDKLEEHHWNVPNTTPNPYYFDSAWNFWLTRTVGAGNYMEDDTRIMMREIRTKPGQKFSKDLLFANTSIGQAQGLNEVVVVGYGAQARRDVTGSVSGIMIRGVASPNDYNLPLIIVDGQIYSGQFNGLNPNSITQIMVLKGADATALYGSKAAQGVVIISTKGPIILPGATEEPVAKVRKNFNETAFFLPQVHAGTDGYYTFSFTMPETATEWNWKMLAHTRNAKFAYLEKKLQTQLNLMVQPNMPRLLYRGDKITLQSRITNLDTLAIQGKATCKIEDAVTGEDLTAAIIESSTQAFKLNKKSLGAVSFSLRIPAQQPNPLKIVVTATSGSVADAEEHIIPILSTKVFTRQSQAIHFTNEPTITVSPAQLPADALLYGVGLSITQKPQASLIYALPWLANYSYDCAEQSFNKLRAKVTALKLMQQDTVAQKAFKNAAVLIEKDKPKNDQLTDELPEEAMPWLNIGNQTARQQKQLFHLLDTSLTKTGIEQHLDKLYKLQQADGGITWFEGGKSNAYISAYVLAGFGQLKQMGWVAASRRSAQQTEFINRLVKYQQNLLLSNAQDKYYDLYQLYALSYWIKDNPLPAGLSEKINSILESAWGVANTKSLEQQTLLIINSLRYCANGSIANAKAQQQLKNISQLAINDATNGLRWKAIADTEDLNNSAEETMALLAEAFELSGKYKEIQPGIVKWLLTTKQDEHWQTTKATAAAIDLLQKDKGTTFGETKAFSAQIENHNLAVSDGLLDGVPNALVKTKQMPASITLKQQGTNTSGNLTWYYFAEPSKLDTLNKAVKLTKEFYTNDKEKGWQKLSPGTLLKAGDEVRVKLIIETNQRLKFVHISDPRAAAFEPKENNSGYQYNNGFSYYRSVRDTGSEVFTEAIPKGISEITYDLVVAHAGEFASGPAILQCMYQPAMTAYSGTEKIKTN